MGNTPYGSASPGLTYVNLAGGWRILCGLVCCGAGSVCGTIGGICSSGAGGIGAGTSSGCGTIGVICSSGGGGGIVAGGTGTSKSARSVGGGSTNA